MTRYLLGTRLPDDLAHEAERVAALLRSNAPRDEKVDRLHVLIYRFVQAGIEEHFHRPARLFDLSPLLVKAIDVATATTLRVLQSAARRVLRTLTDAELREAADEIEGRLYQVGGGSSG
jgi:hypothetical protein